MFTSDPLEALCEAFYNAKFDYHLHVNRCHRCALVADSGPQDHRYMCQAGLELRRVMQGAACAVLLAGGDVSH